MTNVTLKTSSEFFPIMRKLVSLHNDHVFVFDQEDIGCCFTRPVSEGPLLVLKIKLIPNGKTFHS